MGRFNLWLIKMIVPEPKSIQWADVCRDGGSYVLVYHDVKGLEHELELRVLLSRDGQYRRIGYKPPTVRDRNREGEPVVLSWQEAEVLGKKLTPLVAESVKFGGPSRAAECIQLLALGGQLP